MELAIAAVAFGAFIMAQVHYLRAKDTLTALRRNCFITNEKGHRVRYFDASPEKRAAAEQ